MKKTNRKGFTIVELVIVIAVIAILAAVMIPTFAGIIDKADKNAAQQEATAKYKEAYALDMSDGKLDGKDHGEDIGDSNYKYADDKVTYTYDYKGKYIASFDGSVWTVTEKE